MNTTKKNHIDYPIAVTAPEATVLMFHHLSLAAAFFEAGPASISELLQTFDTKYAGEEEVLSIKSQRQFLVNLNQEYVDNFDEEAEAEGEAEGE